MENVYNNESWRFDEVDSGRYQGINDSGIETFNDHVVKSLTREVIQNSLDARDEKATGPVTVKFAVKKVQVSEIPDSLGLLETLTACVDEANRRKDIKAMNIFTNMVQTIAVKEISVLVISDYNTSGLSKIGKDSGTFDSLVKAEGYSQKEYSSSGGSFGIGKNAAFSASKIRTVFYNTRNVENELGFQGVTILTSHRNQKNGKMRLAKGFYPLQPIQGEHNFFRSILNRNQSGTDIIICGFEDDHFKANCIDTVVNNFFMALEKEQLIVEVEGRQITKNTYGKIIKENYTQVQLNEKKIKKIEQSEYIKTYQFYQALSNNVHIKNIAVENVSEAVEIYITASTDDQLCREVMGVRKSGMCIQSFNRFTGAIKFAAVLYIDTPVLNNQLKLMENPAHNKWEANRHPKGKAQGVKLITAIRKAISEVIELYIPKDDQDDIAIKGLSSMFTAYKAGDELHKGSIKVRQKANKKLSKNDEGHDEVNFAGRFIDPQQQELMYQILEEIYGGLTPSEKVKIRPDENFRLQSNRDVQYSLRKTGQADIYIFKFKVKNNGNYFVDFKVKQTSTKQPFYIKSVCDASRIFEYKLCNNDSSLLMYNVEKNTQYEMKLQLKQPMKCVVEVSIREPKK